MRRLDNEIQRRAAERDVTAEERRAADALLARHMHAVSAELPGQPDDDAAFDRWLHEIAVPALKRRLKTLGPEQRVLLSRYLTAHAYTLLFREVADALVAEGELERNPYDRDQYGRPGTIWPAPGPS